jgi:hypothetical protein
MRGQAFTHSEATVTWCATEHNFIRGLGVKHAGFLFTWSGYKDAFPPANTPRWCGGGKEANMHDQSQRQAIFTLRGREKLTCCDRQVPC